MFGRATITLSIGPHSSLVMLFLCDVVDIHLVVDTSFQRVTDPLNLLMMLLCIVRNS